MNMPLSSVIQHGIQLVRPLLDLTPVVEPIFPKHGNDIITHYRPEPFVGYLGLPAKITVTDLKTGAKRIISHNSLVQFLDQMYQPVESGWFICDM